MRTPKNTAAPSEEVSLEIFTLPKETIKKGDLVEFLGVNDTKGLKGICDLEPGKKYKVEAKICLKGDYKSKCQPENELHAIKVERCLDYWNMKYFKLVKNERKNIKVYG